MAKSDNLRKAKETKNDEFYTRLEDIEAEISQHDDYVHQFQGKTVFCNCDDPECSNFFVFFKLHFKQLGLKKLITTHYNPDGSPSYKIEWEGEMLNDDMVNLIKTPLKGNGDFRSEECIEILKEADVVATNPPFSLYREYLAQLVEYKKQFVILGNPNSIAYKEVFPLLKNGEMFIGYKSMGTDIYFNVSKEQQEKFRKTGKEGSNYVIKNGVVLGRAQAVWFTNFDLDKSHEPLILTKNYKGNESRYPKYDNYDAIECSKVKEIPKDYFPCWYKCPHAANCTYAQTEGKEDKALCEMARNGEIGVPITYLAQHCGDQFEILGSDNDFAKKMEEIDPNGIYTKGGPAFYLKEAKNELTTPDNMLTSGRTEQNRTEQNRTEQNRTEQVQETVQQTHYSTVVVSATESSASQSHSLLNSARNNSGLLDPETENAGRKSELEEYQKKSKQRWLGTQLQETSICSLTEDQKFHITESLFKDCRKCNGVIGVPVTYLAEHCAEQFTILGQTTGRDEFDRLAWPSKKYVNPKQYLYNKKDRKWVESNGSKINTGCELRWTNRPEHETYYIADNTNFELKRLYNRILIQRKPSKE